MPSDDFLIGFEDDAPVSGEEEGPPTFVALAEAVQLLVKTSRSWTIHVTNSAGVSGVVGTRPGRVCYASAGSLKGEEAFFQLMSWGEGRIERQTADSQPDEIQSELASLLMEAYWYASEHQGEVMELAQTVEVDSTLRISAGSGGLSPALLSKIAELEDLDGFLGVYAYEDGELVMELGEEDVDLASSSYGVMRSLWLALGSGVQDVLFRQAHRIQLVVQVEGVDVHVILDRRRVNFAMAVFKVRSVLS